MVVTRNEWGENRVDKHAAFKRRLTMRLMSLAVMPFSVNSLVRRTVVRNSRVVFLANCKPAELMYP